MASSIHRRVLVGRPKNVIDIHTLKLFPDPARPLRNTYHIREVIGRGGFGSVYRVEHFPTRSDRAVKVIRKPSTKDEIENVKTEVQLLIELDHPNILRMFEYFEDSDTIFLVCELCIGGDFSILDPAVDDPHEIRLLFRDVFGALAYCHSQGIAHRDLKFENCLISQGDYRRIAKIIDFGLSAIRDSNGANDDWMRDRVGTVWFSAPEVLEHEKQGYNQECDMWSMGVMLYMILAKQHPCVPPTNWAELSIKQQIVSHPIQTAPLQAAGVDAVARDLVLQLLKKDPRLRIDAHSVLEHRWLQSVRFYCRKPSSREMRRILRQACTSACYSDFQKTVLTLVAHEAEEHEFKDLRLAFQTLDTTCAGWLSCDALKGAIANYRCNLTSDDMNNLMRALDPDMDGKIQCTDWLAATLQPSAITSEKAMREAFNFFDIRAEGKVPLYESRISKIFSADAAAGYSGHCEEDGRKCVDWYEFRELMYCTARKLEQVNLHKK